MWYMGYSDEPKGEDINKEKKNIIKDMLLEDYVKYFLTDDEIASRIIFWAMEDNDAFDEEFAKEISIAQENYFDYHAYYVTELKLIE